MPKNFPNVRQDNLKFRQNIFIFSLNLFFFFKHNFAYFNISVRALIKNIIIFKEDLTQTISQHLGPLLRYITNLFLQISHFFKLVNIFPMLFLKEDQCYNCYINDVFSTGKIEREAESKANIQRSE